jgi:hypothetical protein
LFVCTENFKIYWGQKLVNALRALHSLKYSADTDNPEEGGIAEANNELW